jgi:uncharacterized membrane protein
MELTPRLVAVLGFLALVPEGIYAVASGHLTPVMTVIAVVNIGLIVGGTVLMFGPSPGGSGQSTAH